MACRRSVSRPPFSFLPFPGHNFFTVVPQSGAVLAPWNGVPHSGSETVSESHQASLPTSARRAQRQERQARVGILRNPNRPPQPPPRKAALMGKWPRLRSSRRPAEGDAFADPEAEAMALLAAGSAGAPADARPTTAQTAAQADEAPRRATAAGSAVLHQQGDRITGIDIDGLMDSVRDVGRDASARRSYAADLRAVEGDLGPLNERGNTPQASTPATAPRNNAAQPGDADIEAGDETTGSPAGRSLLRIALTGLAALSLLAVVLILTT